MTELEQALTSYGQWLLAVQLREESGIAPKTFTAQPALRRARKILGDRTLSQEEGSRGDGQLVSIFSLVRYPGPGEKLISAERVAVPLRALTLGTIMPGEAMESVVLWAAFGQELDCWQKQATEPTAFEAFYHLMEKYGWTVPSTVAEGVSVFEQFKAVTAVAHCLEAGEDLALVGGDIPGIQSALYTITSKGAAKGLRGRSFYLQLLGDAVVRYLLTEWGLPTANAIYVAGGNFLILAPADKATGEALDEKRRWINDRILTMHRGELYLCLDGLPIQLDELMTEAFGKKRVELGGCIGARKRQRFVELAEARYEALFEPQGRGGSKDAQRTCDVCYAETDNEPEDEVTKCDHCRSFEDLARDLARAKLMLVQQVTPADPQPGPAWDDGLKMLGFEYTFSQEVPASRAPESRWYMVNDTEFLAHGADGFRFIARTTPVVATEDVAWFRREYPDDEEVPRAGDIKDFHLMARQSVGLKRVGVLRMDVDDLGDIVMRRLEGRTLPQTSALSHALSLFFEGWLNAICQDLSRDPAMIVTDESRERVGLADTGPTPQRAYIIYAGGDDLFIVGSWDRMPLLAERIHQDLERYAGGNPGVHISAGITLEQEKFPLYRSAERAHWALEDEAKEHAGKRAIHFLGFTVAWKDFNRVRELATELQSLVDVGGKENEKTERIPRLLLQTIRSIAQEYRGGLEKNSRQDAKPLYGRWMWVTVYQFHRLASRIRLKSLRERIRALQDEMLTPTVVYIIGLSARWAEFLTRKEAK